MTPIVPVASAVLLIVALAMGVLMILRLPRRRITRPEIWFAASATLLAISYGFWRASGSTGSVAASTEKGCAEIRRDMASSQLERAAGRPSAVVSEADTRGPGAEAWVYSESRCVAHVLNGRVRWIDYE